MANKYNLVALGGTFDLLHKGHIALLEKAFSVSKQVSIGITTDKFCRQMGKIPYYGQNQRINNLKGFLRSKNYAKRAKLLILTDIYGTTLKDPKIQALVVSKETEKGAIEINKQRKKRNLKPLKIIAIAQVNAEDKKPISSQRIRSGQISKNGLLYKNLLLKKSQIQLTQTTRSNLKKPFGKIIKITPSLKSEKSLIAVGDISVSQLLKTGVLPKISIVDFLVNRKITFQNLMQLGFGSANPDVIVKNPPGQISKGLIEEIERALQKKQSSVILVDGEEDLAVIPCLLMSPLGTSIIYGQPQKGAVKVEVTPQTKDKVGKIIGIFK